MEEKSEKRSARRFFCAAERTVLSLLSFGALLFLLFFVIGSAANMWYEEEQLPGRKDLCGLLLLYGVTDMISAVAVCLLSPANRKKRGKGVRPVSGARRRTVRFGRAASDRRDFFAIRIRICFPF